MSEHEPISQRETGRSRPSLNVHLSVAGVMIVGLLGFVAWAYEHGPGAAQQEAQRLAAAVARADQTLPGRIGVSWDEYDETTTIYARINVVDGRRREDVSANASFDGQAWGLDQSIRVTLSIHDPSAIKIGDELVILLPDERLVFEGQRSLIWRTADIPFETIRRMASADPVKLRWRMIQGELTPQSLRSLAKFIEAVESLSFEKAAAVADRDQP